MVLGTDGQRSIPYGFTAPQPRFVVLWGPDDAGVLAARDACLEHQTTVEPWLMRERRHYFTTVVGGEGFYGLEPREAAHVPLCQLRSASGPASSHYWSVWVPLLSWWPMHGRDFLSARPEVGWTAGEVA